MERRGSDTRATEREAKRASQWKEIRQLALLLSAPPALQSDGIRRKLTIDEAMTRINPDPVTVTKRFHARTELRQFIDVLVNPDGKLPEEIERAESLLREISAKHPRRVIKPTNLLDILGIAPTRTQRSKLNPFNFSSRNIPLQPAVQVTPFPQEMNPDSANTEIDISAFLENLRTPGTLQFIGVTRLPTQSTPDNQTPQKDSGTK